MANDRKDRQLPPRWTAERGTARLVEGHPLRSRHFTIELLAEDGAEYFGLRLGGFFACPPGRTLELSTELTVLSAVAVDWGTYAMREWVQAGENTYQVNYVVAAEPEPQILKGYLTVRDDNRTIEPIILFRAREGGGARVTLKLRVPTAALV